MEILKWLHDMLGGTSPKTGYIGSVTTIFAFMDLFKDAVATEGIPTTKWGWLALAFGVAARFSKDEDKTNSQHPSAVPITAPAVSASPVTVLSADGKVVASMSADGKPIASMALLLVGFGMFLSACTSVADLGGNRYAVPTTAEVRSPFGSNLIYGRLDDCEGFQVNPGATMQYRNCVAIHEWSMPMVTQGQGGQIVGGVATGLGIVGAGALVNSGGSVVQSAVQNATQAVTVPAGGGGHKGGHH